MYMEKETYKRDPLTIWCVLIEYAGGAGSEARRQVRQTGQMRRIYIEKETYKRDPLTIWRVLIERAGGAGSEARRQNDRGNGCLDARAAVVTGRYIYEYIYVCVWRGVCAFMNIHKSDRGQGRLNA